MFGGRGARSAFTLLEVVIGLGILSLALLVLVQTQATSVLSTVEADKMMRATELAEEKMTEVLLLTEVEGFTESDKEEQGDFEDFGEEDWRGDDLDLDLQDDDLADFHWAWTVRRIDLTIPTDLAGLMGELEGSGYVPEDQIPETYDNSSLPDLSDYMQPEMITEYLAAYIREVRVVVWWGDEDIDLSEGDEGLPENAVEYVTHVINPTGRLNDPLTGAAND
ncbi:MAG: type II secretion system protein [Deltaproteobacteria bacterium]|nr:MAG: type II secretion system protein [Deltaproteobacteria bacterium]